MCNEQRKSFFFSDEELILINNRPYIFECATLSWSVHKTAARIFFFQDGSHVVYNIIL